MATAPKPGSTTDPTMTVKVNGKSYTARPKEMNALDDMALRRSTGYTVASLFGAAEDNPGLDIVAAIVWLARRQSGETDLPFETVAAELSYSDEVDIEAVEDDAPEA